MTNSKGGKVPIKVDDARRDLAAKAVSSDDSGLLAAIVRSSHDAIITKDLAGIVTSWNTGAERMFGYAALEIIGRPITCLIPPSLIGEEEGILAQILRGESIEHFETVRQTRGGELIDVSVTISPMRDAAGKIVGASKSARDITDGKRAAAALLESEQTFRTMANSIPQLAWIARSDGFIFWYNQRWHDYTGTTPEQMEGWGWQSVHDPEMLPLVLERWGVAIATAQPFEMEFPLRGADGQFRTFLTRVQPLKDATGAVKQWFGTNTDVGVLTRMTDALRATQARLNSTLATASVGTWTWDIVNDVLTADPFTADIFSLEVTAAAQGLPVEAYLKLLHDDDRTPVAEALAVAIAACGNYNVEFRVRQRDGRFLWLQSKGRVEGDAQGRATRFHGAVMDVTEHKTTAEMILSLNVDLELRVMDRTAQLESALKELEAFSYSVSHDLRGPLRSLNGFSQAVLDDYGSLLPEDGRQCLRYINTGARKMGSLIDDLLALSTMANAELRMLDVDTNRLVRGVIDDLPAQSPARNIEWIVGDLAPCCGDPALLKQVWVNLLSNALKYTQKRESAVVEIGYESRPDGVVYFVRDNGAGFDMRSADKIFTAFHRLHAEAEFEGTGVGLAIVKRVLERHGGTIWAEAAVDRGATFYFTVPARSMTADDVVLI